MSCQNFDHIAADIGGGSVSNEETTNLARIPLRWMIRECFRSNTGIMFQSDALRSMGLDPESVWPEVRPRPPPVPMTSAVIQPIPRSPPPPSDEREPSPSVFKTEEELDLEDAMSPIYDQLSLAKWWWILEFLPLRNKFHNGKGKYWMEVMCNFGRARKIPMKKFGVKVHRSVKSAYSSICCFSIVETKPSWQ